LVAYTTCVVTEASPQWHEVFRFDVEHIDPTAYLVAWVISAPGGDFDDIIEGAQHALTEDQLTANLIKRAVDGIDERHHKTDFNKDMRKSMKRQTQRHDFMDDKEVHKNNALARMPVQPPASSYQRHEIPILERRWNDVMNFRQLMQKTGCDIQEPLIPRTHMPLGCIVARFRTLRTAVWGTEPVSMNRALRLSCKGKLGIEIDFRPRYFIAVDPLRSLKGETDFEPRTPRKEDLEETAETAALEAEKASKVPAGHDLILTGAGGQDMRGGREAMQDNPLELFRKYKQVTAWSKAVLKQQNEQLGEENRLLGIDPEPDGISWLQGKVQGYQKRFELYKEKRKTDKANMDRQVQAVALAPVTTMKAQAPPKAQPGDLKKSLHGQLPVLKVEPFMDEFLDGSRFV